MDRRDALKAAALLPFFVKPMLATNHGNPKRRKKTIKPKRLSKGDKVALIAPSSGATDSGFEKGITNLESLGVEVVVAENARKRDVYLAGTDNERLSDLHSAFEDNSIKAVWCVRGGYGTPRLLPKIDYKLIKRNPKILVGYSDATALLNTVTRKTGLVTFHGPAASSTFSDYTKKHLNNTLMNPTRDYRIELPEVPVGEDPANYKATEISAGKCEGKLIGGNLSLIAALAGTPFALDKTKGRILFIEDINEPFYKVDRLLTQLRQSMKLAKLEGIAIGVFTSGRSSNPTEYTNGVNKIFKERLGNLGIPIVSGLSFGHIEKQFTLPIGLKAELNTNDATISFKESPVR